MNIFRTLGPSLGRQDELIPAQVTTSSPSREAMAWCGDECWGQPISSPYQRCSRLCISSYKYLSETAKANWAVKPCFYQRHTHEPVGDSGRPVDLGRLDNPEPSRADRERLLWSQNAVKRIWESARWADLTIGLRLVVKANSMSAIMFIFISPSIYDYMQI